MMMVVRQWQWQTKIRMLILIRFKWLLNVPRLLSLTLHNVKVFSIPVFTITIIMFNIYFFTIIMFIYNHYATCSWLAYFGAVSTFVMDSQKSKQMRQCYELSWSSSSQLWRNSQITLTECWRVSGVLGPAPRPPPPWHISGVQNSKSFPPRVEQEL